MSGYKMYQREEYLSHIKRDSSKETQMIFNAVNILNLTITSSSFKTK